MWQYFTEKNTRKWVDILDELVGRYNSRKHKTLGMSPNEAVKVGGVYKEKKIETKKAKPAFKVGDIVRISKVKGLFEKGYLPNWSREMFVIHKINNTTPITYAIKDYHDEIVKGSFYEKELQIVDKKIQDLHLIEKILERKGNKVLVKRLDWNDSFNKWIPAKHAEDLMV